MLNKLFEKISSQKGCITFEKCSNEDIKKANQELSDNGFCLLPQEYAVFLQIYNGIIYDGLEFFGTIPHKRLQKNYILNSILDINKRYSSIDFFDGKLILGELPESFLLYNSETQSYEIIDRLNLDSKRIFNSFSEFIKTITSFLTIKN